MRRTTKRSVSLAMGGDDDDGACCVCLEAYVIGYMSAYSYLQQADDGDGDAMEETSSKKKNKKKSKEKVREPEVLFHCFLHCLLHFFSLFFFVCNARCEFEFL